MHDRFRELVKQRYLTVQRHPTLPLSIYNYSKSAQYDRYWTPETIMCRGLILDDAGRVVARPLPKFFNLDELGPEWQVPPGPFEVTTKLDGSLGISYPTPDGPAIATRGSFVGAQAMHATDLLRSRYASLPWDLEHATYLFEIIYPENRIVVDYGDMNDLILIAVIDTATGADLPLPEWFPNRVARHDAITDLTALAAMPSDNGEGFVVRFADGTRVKIKFAEYVRLHRLLTGVTPRRIWELLAAGQDIGDLVKRVPEEFAEWVNATTQNLKSQQEEICADAMRRYEELKGLSRKDAAMRLQLDPLRTLVFLLMDGRDITTPAWRMLRPAAELPFREDSEA